MTEVYGIAFAAAELANQEEFLENVRARLAKGFQEYGNQSVGRPALNTRAEILEEIEDIAGWAFVMWCQARQRLEAVAERIDAKHSTAADGHNRIYPCCQDFANCTRACTPRGEHIARTEIARLKKELDCARDEVKRLKQGIAGLELDAGNVLRPPLGGQ